MELWFALQHLKNVIYFEVGLYYFLEKIINKLNRMIEWIHDDKH